MNPGKPVYWWQEPRNREWLKAKRRNRRAALLARDVRRMFPGTPFETRPYSDALTDAAIVVDSLDRVREEEA